MASSAPTVRITFAYGSGLFPPSSFTVTRITDTHILLEWVPGASSNSTLIIAKIGSPPTSRADGYTVYYGNGTSANDTFTDLDVIGAKVYYAAFSENATGSWSADWSTGEAEGIGMTLIALGMLAVGLTIAMFMSRNAMLGFPSVIMWAILGAYAYTTSTVAWGDWQFYLFIGSLLGMVPFCAYAGYALREKKDLTGTDSDEYIDEKGGGAIDGIQKEKVNTYMHDGDGSGFRSRLRERIEKRRQKIRGS